MADKTDCMSLFEAAKLLIVLQGKKDNENLDDNYQFYMNRIPSKPDGMFS